MNRHLLLGTVVALLASCDAITIHDDGGPSDGDTREPTPVAHDAPASPDPTKLIVSPGSSFTFFCQFPREVKVKALANAVAAGAHVQLQNLANKGVDWRYADEHGAFESRVTGCSGDRIRLVVWVDSKASAPVDLTVP